MVILGIDPGYARAGWGVISQVKNKQKLISCGCFETPAGMPHPERLKKLSDEITKLIKKYHPDTLAIEELFFFKNLKTAIKVAESRGVILAQAFAQDLIIREFTPLQIKQAITSYGRADKKQMQEMIKIILNLKTVPQPDDAADAIAVAVTCGSMRNHKL